MISLCGQRQELGKALKLVADMRGRGITPNIHTYTALINTCIRSGDYTLALDVFKTLEVLLLDLLGYTQLIVTSQLGSRQ